MRGIERNIQIAEGRMGGQGPGRGQQRQIRGAEFRGQVAVGIDGSHGVGSFFAGGVVVHERGGFCLMATADELAVAQDFEGHVDGIALEVSPRDEHRVGRGAHGHGASVQALALQAGVVIGGLSHRAQGQ